MAKFNVQVTIRLELGASFTITAKNQEAAEEKAQKLIDDGIICVTSWSGDKRSQKLDDIEWTESDQFQELDAVNEE